MQPIADVVRGALKLNDLPERYSFTSWADFVRALPQFFSVELPVSVSGVVVSKVSPSEDDRDKVWYRRDGLGNFLGVYAFQAGAWRLLHSRLSNEVIWVVGVSTSVPDGFVLIDTGDAVIPDDVVNAIKSHYVPDGLGNFSYFAVRFNGY